jgi:hypothetical protein
MAKILRVEDASKAVTYIQSQLECGGNLFKRAREAIALGSFYVIVPDGSPDDIRAYPFERGLGASRVDVVPAGDATEAASEVFEVLSGGNDWLVVADAHHLKPEYPAVRRVQLAVRTFGADVYFIGGVKGGRDHVRSLILLGSSSWYGATMLVGARIPEAIVTTEHWGEDDLSTLVSGMKALLVAAHDQQAYVLWLSQDCDASGLNANREVRWRA